MLKANCPSCSAEITFANKASLFTVCAYCGSSIVREDINLRTLGTMAELQDDGSVIQLGVTGTHGDRSFRVVGRVQRAYALGFWNDWYLSFAQGEPAWLSEAMGFYSILSDVAVPKKIEPMTRRQLGQRLGIGDAVYCVKSVLVGEWAGAEGELPFAMRREAGVFVDLAGKDNRCATISFVGKEPPRFSAGRYVTFEKLRLDGIRRPEGW